MTAKQKKMADFDSLWFAFLGPQLIDLNILKIVKVNKNYNFKSLKFSQQD